MSCPYNLLPKDEEEEDIERWRGGRDKLCDGMRPGWRRTVPHISDHKYSTSFRLRNILWHRKGGREKSSPPAWHFNRTNVFGSIYKQRRLQREVSISTLSNLIHSRSHRCLGFLPMLKILSTLAVIGIAFVGINLHSLEMMVWWWWLCWLL